MLGSEDGTVSVGLEDGTILGKTEDGASLGKMLELGWLLGTVVGASLGKRLVLEDGTVFVRSGVMLGLEDGKELGKSLGTIERSTHHWAKGLVWRLAQCLWGQDEL